MWRAWKNAVKVLTQQDGYLRDKLGIWEETPKERRYKWMQGGEYAYEEDEVCIKRYKIQEKSRRTAKIAERYIPVDERTGRCVPTSKPIERKIEIAENAIEKDQRYKQITDAIKIKNRRSLDHLTRNLHIEDDERLNEMMARDHNAHK